MNSKDKPSQTQSIYTPDSMGKALTQFAVCSAPQSFLQTSYIAAPHGIELWNY